MNIGDRKSTTDDEDDLDEIIPDSDAVALQEARNGLLQFDEVVRLAESFLPAQKFEAASELILHLNQIAIQGIRRSAGTFRQGPVGISNTLHVPPTHEEVPRFVSEMCEYVNGHWNEYGMTVRTHFMSQPI